VPFGFASAGPDMTSGPSSGYDPTKPILGFSQTHVSGTGGAGKYGNFRVTPFVGRLAGPWAWTGERPAPGYYAVRLVPAGIEAELTATRLGAVHRYLFPRSARPGIAIDPRSVVETGRYSQRVLRARMRQTGRRSLEGGTSLTGGWGAGRYRLYFAARLDRDFRLRGTRLFFHGRSVQLAIGLSFRSATAARAHIPRGGFERVRRAARAAWARELRRVQVEGGTPAQRTILATALYHSLLMPHDLTGDNAWWRSREPHYEDFFTLWDTFRTQNPLLTLIDPNRESALVRSLLDTWRHTGWLPDGRVAGANGLTQVGSNGDVVVADAVVKDLPGIDRRAAYRALAKDASVQPRHPVLEGRELGDWRRLGYVSLSQPRSASRTMEYAYDDFAVGEVARKLGRTEAARRWFARAGNWAKLWDPSTRSIRPRYADGRFLEPFDPAHREQGFSAPFYEGSALEYTTFVPHDVQGLIDRLGGDGAATAWLDDLFSSGAYDPSNEPDLLAPYLYIHAGRPDRTDDTVRRLLASAYATGRSGLPGNDDAGALSAWYVWGAIGLYPNAGQPYYYVGSPLFSRVRLGLGRGRSFVIEAPDTSDANRYVRSASLNGRPLERAFVTHAEVARGGLLRLEMGASPSGWGARPRPFSLSLAQRGRGA
jgi:predicted alpha-1,2-mannosidase